MRFLSDVIHFVGAGVCQGCADRARVLLSLRWRYFVSKESEPLETVDVARGG
jgi:hypothetical protein